MVWIPGGTFLMGSDHHYPEEAPAHRVSVDGFWMDATTVTNRDFAHFVKATGYITLAERPADPADYPGARPELLAASSILFRKPSAPVDMSNHYNWWHYVAGADWRHPRGPASSIRGLMDHPVVHVAWEDVAAYAHWACKALPTEAEWEFAARGGLDGREFVWGDDLPPNGKYMANTWQGEFPYRNTREDGFEYTSPVRAFPPNGYGLYDMAGNVWQWTADWYGDHGTRHRSCCTVANPRGGAAEESFDPNAPGMRIPRRVTKGGSHLCAPNYCRRYRPAARMAQPIDTAISHLGFRCIKRPAPKAEAMP
ncbi:formylglycine-generating enzyme family protein [Sphingomonas fennica]|uniref:Gliding motility-associated lipoprotein GldK n=1 Tax=Edaphosphingomonas fennica TaxID=114404 RepID=A0A2T4I6P6_9SPHN|nr:formylglycine-generating enzyme family protein [Sphingomonas fennica]PTD26308.1 gliding motility-associated lipoprotein GldK [Sphingomonas fennica]